MNNNCCANCQSPDSITNPVETHMIEGAWTPLCDECMEERQRIERKADELAALPSCDYRAMIIDREQSAAVLVNALRAHDLSCSCTIRKPIVAELVAVMAPAVLEGGIA
jgi:hypothetical protein